MKYLTAKLVAASFFVFGALTQQTINPSDPSWGWDDFKQLKCADGYNKVANYCVKCNTTTGKFFDPVTKQCRTCPTGTKYNAISQACDCQCKAPKIINPQTNQCECPEDKPLWNGKNCVSCPPGTNFDEKEHQCYHCPEGFVRNPGTHQCQPGL